MLINLKEAGSIQVTPERKSWVQDSQISKYLILRDKPKTDPKKDFLTNFEKFYEVYELDKHVGDIKVFYETEEDIFKKRAQIIMVIGKRNNGIGSNALKLLLKRVKNEYQSLYCVIDRANIASLKILKRNGFHIDKFERDKVRLSHQLS
jgi:RimJ/RimL family protein N-acetyltransferase